MMSNLPRYLLSAALAAAIVGWMSWEYAFTQSRLRWDVAAKVNGLASTMEPEASEPPSIGRKLVVARAIEEVRFPPDYPLMLKLANSALQGDPQRSEVWILAARALLFQGLAKEAAAALTYSARLDPNFPGQRQESIPLWTMLNRNEEAEQIAKELSALGVDSRRRAAKALLQSAYPPRVAFEILGGPKLPPAEIADLLAALQVKGPAMSKLMAAVPDSAFEDPEFRSNTISLVLDPIMADEAMRLWGAERQLEPSPDGDFPVDNPLMTRLPWSPPFPLGWSEPKAPLWLSVDWLPPARTGTDEGEVRLTFRDSDSKETETFRWDFYHLLVPANQALNVSIRLRVEPPGRSTCSFYVGGEKGSGWGDVTDFAQIGWQVREHLITAEPNARIVTLGLQRDRRGGAGEGRVTLGRLRIRKVAPNPPPG